MNKKPVKKWVALLALPLPLIILAWFLMAFALFSSPDSDPTFIGGVLSLVALLAGIAGIVLFLGSPIWIIKLVHAHKHNSHLKNNG